MENEMTQKHGHYYKDITNLKKLDVYRIAELYNVNGAIEHAIKKLLLAGGRGVKDMRTDIQEAIDSLNRKLEMLNEDEDVEMMDKQNDFEDKIVENIKYPLPATSLNTRCYVAEVDEQEEISFSELDDSSFFKLFI